MTLPTGAALRAWQWQEGVLHQVLHQWCEWHRARQPVATMKTSCGHAALASTTHRSASASTTTSNLCEHLGEVICHMLLADECDALNPGSACMAQVSTVSTVRKCWADLQDSSQELVAQDRNIGICKKGTVSNPGQKRSVVSAVINSECR